MLYQKFIIQKYKALSNVEVNLKHNLIPIIGINESGKTSVLQAILAFDSNNDEILNSIHLEAKNRYDYDSNNHTIVAHVLFENEKELNKLLTNSGFKKTNKLYSDIFALYQKDQPLVLSRNLDTREYKIENIKTTYPSNMIDDILALLPYILYFDDFNDRVPDKIVFPNRYKLSSYRKEEDSLRKEWNSYIEEIFLRASKKTLTEFLNNVSKNDREAIISDVNDKINEDIIDGWKKLKILNNELKEEKITDLEIKLNYEEDKENNFIFQFKIKDKNYKNKSRFFDISERSKGFQWFFNFEVKLKYNPKYISSYEGAIYLLDEPGSYLHASAQEELLKSLQKISETNKVLYCTHSQYLLSPDIININHIKIASKNSGEIKLENFGEYKDSNKNFSALNPLFDALHLSILYDKNSIINQRIIITEGITDFYFLKMIKKYLPQFSELPSSIIPGSGADNLKDLISFAIAWSTHYKVLFDKDEKGLTAKNKYTNIFGEKEAVNFLLYSIGHKHKVKLEDFLSTFDQNRLLEITNAKDLKKGIIALYFDSEENQKKFFNELSDETSVYLSFFDNLNT